VKTDALIISSHRSKPQMDYSSLKRAQKPCTEKKHLRTETNFQQSLGKFSTTAQAGNPGKETITAGSHLAFAFYETPCTDKRQIHRTPSPMHKIHKVNSITTQRNTLVLFSLPCISQVY